MHLKVRALEELRTEHWQSSARKCKSGAFGIHNVTQCHKVNMSHWRTVTTPQSHDAILAYYLNVIKPQSTMSECHTVRMFERHNVTP